MLPPTKQILRAQLRSFPANGHTAYLPTVRKVVLEFCQKLPSSANTRTFISNDLQRVAWQNPHVEFVVKQRNGHEPIARGFYGAVLFFLVTCQPILTSSMHSQWP
jgi:large subunit ribosomal protein L43